MVDSTTVPLICNPTAGRGRAGRLCDNISSLLKANGVKNEPVLTDGRGDLEARTADLIATGHRRLIVVGGDGSVHEAANAVMTATSAASLGVIPTGSGNDFAKACSIPLHWEHATALLADRLVSGAPAIKIDVGRCNERFFVNSLGIGFDAHVSALAERVRLPLGDVVYLVALVRALTRRIETPELRLRCGDREIIGSVTLASFSNGPWVGGVFNIAPDATNDDGLLDLVYAEPVRRTRVLALLPKILRGTHMKETEVHGMLLKSCRIEARAPVTYHLDGEIRPPGTRFDVEVLAGALDLL